MKIKTNVEDNQKLIDTGTDITEISVGQEHISNDSGKNAKQNDIRKIIFDLDNTLLFLSDKWLEIYGGFIDKYNLNVSVKDLYFTIDEIEKNNSNMYITEEFLIDHINSRLSLNLDKEQFAELLEEYAKIPLLNIDAVRDVLSYLSNKYQLIAYTNWFTDNQILRLKLNGIDKYFSKVFGWDILPAKPSKKGLDEIIGKDNIKDYIFIGDNIDIDIKLPDSVGMKTILYNYKNIIQDKYNEVRSIDELKNML